MSARPATCTPDAVSGAAALAQAPLPPELERATLAVLMGGRSSEREVSLTSGRTVLEALATPSGPEDRRGPGRVIAVELLQDGRWRVGKRLLLPGEAVLALADVDLVFSALHGGEGENGSLQGFLTCCDLAFTGSGVIASAVAMDKLFARQVVAARGVRVARALSFSRAEWTAGEGGLARELDALAARGCVVKPRRGGSSLGCSLVERSQDLGRALELSFLEGREVLVEELVRGVEATVAVIDVPGAGPIALPPVEIRPRSAFFDYREKYAADGALELCPPESLDDAACARLAASALAAHRALGCEGYSRTDYIVPAAEDDGAPVFLETNTLPGLTPRSLLPRAAAAAGIDYRTLCLWIAAQAFERERREG